MSNPISKAVTQLYRRLAGANAGGETPLNPQRRAFFKQAGAASVSLAVPKAEANTAGTPAVDALKQADAVLKALAETENRLSITRDLVPCLHGHIYRLDHIDGLVDMLGTIIDTENTDIAELAALCDQAIATSPSGPDLLHVYKRLDLLNATDGYWSYPDSALIDETGNFFTDFRLLTKENILAANSVASIDGIDEQSAEFYAKVSQKLVDSGIKTSDDFYRIFSEKRHTLAETLITRTDLWPRDDESLSTFLKNLADALPEDEDEERVEHLHRLSHAAHERHADQAAEERKQEWLNHEHLTQQRLGQQRLEEQSCTVKKIERKSLETSFAIFPPGGAHLTTVDIFQMLQTLEQTRGAQEKITGRLGTTRLGDRCVDKHGVPYYELITRDEALITYLDRMAIKETAQLPFSERALTRPAPMKLEKLPALMA